MNKETNPKAFEATEDQIKQWQEQYGSVFRLVSKGEKACYLKPVDRQMMSFLSQAGTDPVAFNEALLKNTWIEGDKEIIEKDEYFLAVMEDLASMLDFGQSSLEKL